MEKKLGTRYNDAVQQIKAAILKSQAKALVGINQEQLSNWFLGQRCNCLNQPSIIC